MLLKLTFYKELDVGYIVLLYTLTLVWCDAPVVKFGFFAYLLYNLIMWWFSLLLDTAIFFVVLEANGEVSCFSQLDCRHYLAEGRSAALGD